MDASAFLALALKCAPAIHTQTARALVQVESGFNPWAIGVVGGRLLRQPRTQAEALATARALRTGGWNFSVGLAQINLLNLHRLGLTLETAFEPCTNLGAMQTILDECFERATATGFTSRRALGAALSCYYSGDFETGFRHGYVLRVAMTASEAGRISTTSSRS
ncbi:lytic transglycosylase domain-containing protein [Roseateles sp.]|uniref:lytic transglycosylase domain-containing protein n=1 Tax=Roseateles sp. TaxID=1971397 RepID=UPI002DFAB187|nr:lytic transglycosylase domain-containing protein [Roseateles sp.]